MLNLRNKTILITGASRGIGLELSKHLEQEGANLILVARHFEQGDKIDKHIYIEADLTIESSFDLLSDRLQDINIDILVNNAAIGIYKDFESVSEKEFEESLKLNVIAPFKLAKRFKTKLEKSDIGLVLNIGSGAGTMPFARRSAYTTSKYALRGLSLSLSEEFKESKPTFCLVTLGSTMTTFAGKAMEEQQKKVDEGRAIFPVEYVAKELVSIIKNDKREEEIVLYPGDRGFGTWVKPK